MSDTPPIRPGRRTWAREIRGRWPGLVWAVPIAALMIVAYLALRAVADPGVNAVIVFKNAAGAVAGDTKVIYRGLQVGHVTRVVLDKDGRSVDVTVRLAGRVRPALNTSTEFWIEGANFSLTDLSAIKAAVSGVTIGMAAGTTGTPTRHFVGLDVRPSVLPDEKGTAFWLQTDNMGAVRAGSNVTYRGMTVGKIAEVEVNGPQVLRAEAFVDAPYDQLVHPHSLFWSISPLKISVSGSGLGASFDPAAALGAVTFETPPEYRDDGRATPGTAFKLYPDDANAFGEGVGPKIFYSVEFPDPVGDLKVGAPVMLGGFQIGSVQAVDMHLDPDTGYLTSPVTIAVEPVRMHLVGVTEPANGDWRPVTDKAITSLLAKGYRARLGQSPPLIGARRIELAKVRGAGGARLLATGGYPEIPSHGGADLGDQASQLLDNLNSVPLGAIGENVKQLTGRLSQILKNPKIDDSIAHLDDTLDQTSKMMHEVRPQVGPLVTKLRDAAGQLDQTAASANQLISGEGAAQDRSLPDALHELTNAARSLRALADQLERHPESLIRGKGKEH